MRATAVAAVVLLGVCVVLYWVPLPPVELGGNRLILGGYPWHAPAPQARSFFIALGVALTALAAVLALLAAFFGRESDGGEEPYGE